VSYDQDYGPYHGAAGDPRTPDEPDRYSWEETIAYSEILDDLTIDEVLGELLHGSADAAKRTLDAAVAVEFMLHQQRMKRHGQEAKSEERHAA
jgi:hypothetical protein